MCYTKFVCCPDLSGSTLDNLVSIVVFGSVCGARFVFVCFSIRILTYFFTCFHELCVMVNDTILRRSVWRKWDAVPSPLPDLMLWEQPPGQTRCGRLAAEGPA